MFDMVISMYFKDFIIISVIFFVVLFIGLALVLREKDIENLLTLGFMSVFATFIFGLASFMFFPSVMQLMKDSREHEYQEAYNEFKEHFNPSNVDVLTSKRVLMKGEFLNYKVEDKTISDKEMEELNDFRDYCSEYYLTCTITYDEAVYFAFLNGSFHSGRMFKENLKGEHILYTKGIKFTTSLDNFK